MASFHLKIVTPDALIYDGEAERIIVRTVTGDVAILPRHIDYLTALGTGEARVTFGGHVRKAKCSGGMLQLWPQRHGTDGFFIAKMKKWK